MRAGKLPVDLLFSLLDGLGVSDPRVVLGPRAGEDAALIDMGDRYLVATMDPITFAADLIGSYLVQVNANDLAVMGATPRWLMTALLFPEGTQEAEVERVFGQLGEACEALDIAIVGGHTEIAVDLPRPIAVGAMLGDVAKDRVVLSSGARAGDSIVLTKGVAVEGTALLAREAAPALREAGVSGDTIERAAGLLLSPGISVVREAAIACDSVDVHAMHDPTEGGVATGLMEMATASGVGAVIESDRLHVLPECAELCAALALDPLGLIASGSLLAAVAPGEARKLLEALAREGIAGYEIGRVTDASEGLKLLAPDGARDLPRFARDELARFFER